MTLRLAPACTITALALLAACAPGESPSTDAASAVSTALPMDSAVMGIASRTPDSLGTFNGVAVYASGYGSSMAVVPGASRSVWLLTDRGPNIDGPDGSKVFPDPSYSPRLYRAQIADSTLLIDGEVILRRADGTPLTGIPIGAGQCGSTGEAALRLDVRTPITPDPEGIDSEGLVALPDGTFWIADEYGPFLAHFAADGRQITRLSPCNGGLPSVYAKRRANRGMEGLTVTPDGQWLVGIMQAPLNNPSSDGVQNVSRLTRILFRHLVTGATKEYAYLLERADLQGTSEIVALSDSRFLILEHDGRFLFGSPVATLKRIYAVDVTGATDISTLGALGATPIRGTKTLEQATVAELAAAGIVAVTKRLAVDLLAVGYMHDKPEGIALLPGNVLLVVNDDDFGITAQGSTGTLVQKLLPPTTSPDRSEIWQLRLR